MRFRSALFFGLDFITQNNPAPNITHNPITAVTINDGFVDSSSSIDNDGRVFDLV